MNLKSILNGLAILLPMALATQAATPTILDWQFASGTRPLAPDGTNTVNNTGGTASFNLTGGTFPPNRYSFPSRAGEGYGSAQGTYDVIGSQFVFNIQAGTTSPGETLNYTLRITQFTDSPSGTFPGLLSFSLGAPLSSSRTVLQNASLGQWVEDTFTWTVTPSQMYTPLTLTIAADTSTGGTGELFFDRVRWDIVGDIAVPEPHAQALAALGFLAFGVRSWFRRKV